MEYRKITADDAKAFRELRVEMCTLHPEAFGQSPEEVLSRPDDDFIKFISPSTDFPQKFVLGTFDNGKLVGSVGLFRNESAKERHRAWIWTVFVKPEYRGKGISRQLMQYTIDEARKIEGLECLVLEVGSTQTSARVLYTAVGFHTIGLDRKAYKLADGRYIDHEIMAMWL